MDINKLIESKKFITFEKDGIQSTLDKHFDTIMEAVEYFYNFLKTI